MANLIFGCGYLGQRVARLWRDQGQEVYAVTRSLERAKQLAGEGLKPLVGNIDGSTQLLLPQGVRTVLFAVGFDDRGRSIHDVYVGGITNALRSLPETIERFIYISSTGVYGKVTGREVDEDSPCQPTREGGQACLAAETVLRASRFSSRSIILRLAGLYGPGRIPRAEDLAAGKPIEAPAAGWLNLIHVEDAARIVLQATDRAASPRTYVVSDGHPIERRDYYAELARLLGAPPPQFQEPPADSPAALRASSDKRVNPRRMLAELAPPLLYPSYREGLAAIVLTTKNSPRPG